MICFKCNNTFPIKITIDGKTHYLSNRKYCLDCSPFGKRNTRKLERVTPSTKWCPKCEQTLSKDKFYTCKSGKWKGKLAPYCNECYSKDCATRNRRKKQWMVNYKGGQCNACGYKKCLGAMEFHHQSGKEFSLSSNRKRSKEELKIELDKCVLLCANCHREVHVGELTLEGIAPSHAT